MLSQEKQLTIEQLPLFEVFHFEGGFLLLQTGRMRLI